MNELHVVATRGELAETVHRVSVAVTDAAGALVAQAGDPGLVTFWRSAAKPFQLMPLVVDGGVERYGLDRDMLALACGSHNAETIHREVGARWLARVGLSEADLACGGHPSLWSSLADEMVRERVQPTPLWSNCSGKHSALLAEAKLRGWPTVGYEDVRHPVQQRVAETIAEWSGCPAERLAWGVDGCTAAAVALPLTGMATAYARFATREASAARAIRDAMMGAPYLVAGADRLDTALMEGWRERIVVKVGAEGVYSAALPELGLGVSLKVEDGDGKAANVALLAVLAQVTARFGATFAWPMDALERWRAPAMRNTRGAVTGRKESRGTLRFA